MAGNNGDVHTQTEDRVDNPEHLATFAEVQDLTDFYQEKADGLKETLVARAQAVVVDLNAKLNEKLGRNNGKPPRAFVRLDNKNPFTLREVPADDGKGGRKLVGVFVNCLPNGGMAVTIEDIKNAGYQASILHTVEKEVAPYLISLSLGLDQIDACYGKSFERDEADPVVGGIVDETHGACDQARA